MGPGTRLKLSLFETNPEAMRGDEDEALADGDYLEMREKYKIFDIEY
jgi:hypothetical protein